LGLMSKVMHFLGLQDEEDSAQPGRLGAAGDGESEPVVQEFRKHRGNVVSIHAQKQVRVVLSEPRSYEEAQEIADHLRSRRPVVINLQRMRKDHALRIIDFLSGTVYALNGNIAKLGSNIFMCTPDTVEIEGVITEMLQQDETNP